MTTETIVKEFEEIRDYSASNARMPAYVVGDIIKDHPVVERLYDEDGDLIAEYQACGSRDAIVIGHGAIVTGNVTGDYYPVLLKPAPRSKYRPAGE